MIYFLQILRLLVDQEWIQKVKFEPVDQLHQTCQLNYLNSHYKSWFNFEFLCWILKYFVNFLPPCWGPFLPACKSSSLSSSNDLFSYSFMHVMHWCRVLIVVVWLFLTMVSVPDKGLNLIGVPTTFVLATALPNPAKHKKSPLLDTDEIEGF